jgi:hypothetical protein
MYLAPFIARLAVFGTLVIGYAPDTKPDYIYPFLHIKKTTGACGTGQRRKTKHAHHREQRDKLPDRT